MERKTFDGNGHDIDVNNASFPKQAGSYSIRVFSDGGHTLHERKISLLMLHQLTQRRKINQEKGMDSFSHWFFVARSGIPLYHGPR